MSSYIKMLCSANSTMYIKLATTGTMIGALKLGLLVPQAIYCLSSPLQTILVMQCFEEIYHGISHEPLVQVYFRRPY